LLLGHINVLVKRALEAGCNLFKVLQVACLNPAMHYKTKHGLLQVGDAADFIVVNNLQDWQVLQTFIRGNLVAETGETCCPYIEPICLNNFLAEPISLEDLAHLPRAIEPVIVCIDGQLITESKAIKRMDCTPQNDCLKLVVVNRYTNAKPAIAYVKNFGLTQGAIASSVAHDSHNIIAVGYSDADILKAVNIVIAEKGALVACNEKEQIVLPLPIAGLMSNLDAWQVAQKYTHLDRFSKEVLGSSLTAPLMSLSFMALLVIPHLKLSDLGLFNGNTFEFVERD
jgi:adenine deaminase